MTNKLFDNIFENETIKPIVSDFEKEYKESFNEILDSLKTKFDDNEIRFSDAKMSAWLLKSKSSVTKIKTDIEKNNKNYYFVGHAELWSKTSRNSATYIPGQPDEKSPHRQLMQCINELQASSPKHLSLQFKLGHITENDLKHYKELQNELKEAKRNLKDLRKKSKRKWLYQFKNQLIQELLVQLGNDDKDEELKKIREELGALKSLVSQDQKEGLEEKSDNFTPLKTKKDVLEAHKRLSQLQKRIEKRLKNKNVENKADTLRLTKEMSIITKRWMDPYYKNPIDETKIDKLRKGIKLISFIIAGVFSFAALGILIASLFTPAAPIGIVGILGMIGLIGLTPLADTFINSIHSAIVYHRSPLTAQVTEMVVAPIVLSLIILGSHLAGLGSLMHVAGSGTWKLLKNSGHWLKHAGKHIANGFNKIASILQSKKTAGLDNEIGAIFMNAFGGTVNSLATFIFGGIAVRNQIPKGGKDVKNYKQLKQVKSASAESAKKILLTANDATFSIERKNKGPIELTNKSNAYIYLDTNNNIRRRGSLREEIVSVNFYSLWSLPQGLRMIIMALREYEALTAGASLTQRKEKLTTLSTYIKNYHDNNISEYSRYKQKLDKLKDNVDHEINTINKLMGEAELKEGKTPVGLNNDDFNKENTVILARMR